MFPLLVLLLNGRNLIATLALSTANVSLKLHDNTMQIEVQLGNFTLTDESSIPTSRPEYKQIVSIEGSNLLDLTYETFDMESHPPEDGANSSVSLRSGSIKVHFLEQPLHDIYAFLIKFARLKSLYDMASQAAVQKASEIQRMRFDVSVQSPIIVFPDESVHSQRHLILRLGGVATHNEYSGDMGKIVAGLTGISVVSAVPTDGEDMTLSIVDAIDINANVTQRLGPVPIADQKAETEVNALITEACG